MRPTPPRARLAELAQAILRSRGERQSVLPARYFGEPGWDILLALYVAQAADQAVAVGAVGTAAGVPPTIALRTVALLEQDQWLVRLPADHDCGVTSVAITPAAQARLERWLAGHFRLAER